MVSHESNTFSISASNVVRMEISIHMQHEDTLTTQRTCVAFMLVLYY